MYIKALELRGFKSFPELTTLNFDKPMTAIVGPNGSGKSNIADALQWVMGEQSTKALRGGKMEDVIFGGTERRSQVGFAQVSLTLDNSDRRLPGDLDEVQVTRRYYRSGESEYFINKKPVRLRDINELFMDTGLGRDGYSIIGQGKIDSILSAKSTDRREIFEEAAGISRYRHRKEESEHKLQHAEEDLTRVNDKISELELQVEPLRCQSETAKRYLILRDELRGLEISLWLSDLENIGDRERKLQEDAKSSQEELERARDALQRLYDSGEEFSQRMREKDVEAEAVREDISKTELKIAEEESAAAVLEANLGHTRESVQRTREELELREGQSKGILSQIEERTLRLNEIYGERKELEEEYRKLEESLKTICADEGEGGDRLTELSERAAAIQKELSERRVELSSVKASLAELEERRRDIENELHTQTEKLGSSKAEAEGVKSELGEAEEAVRSLNNILRGYNLRAEGLRRRAEERNQRLTALQVEAGNLSSRRQMLSEMEREYEGYSKAVKVVMREASRGVLRGIHGPAGELIKAGDKYALAIETALGPAMQNIIVTSEQDGKNAINLLKRTEAGRVTFLPMSVIHGNRLNERGLEDEEGLEGLAIDLVTFDKKYRDIYLNLLGRTAIAEDLDSAIAIARRHGHRFKIVTLDGQTVNAGGSMTGGSASRNTGILSRANELESLKKREAEVRLALETAQKESAEGRRTLEAVERELTLSSQELREAENRALGLSNECRHYELLISSVEERIAELTASQKSFSVRCGECKSRASELEGEISSLEAGGSEIEDELSRQGELRDRISRRRLDAERRQGEIRERRASLEAESLAVKNAIGELQSLREQFTGGREAQERAIQELEERSREICREIELRRGRIAVLREAAEAGKSKIAGITEAKLAIEAQRARGDKLLQDKNNELLNLERVASRIEQRIQAAQMEEKQIIDKLWDNYELSRSEAIAQRMELASVQEAKRRTVELRREMSSLGTPNLGSIEEFERVNTRYEYLTGQRDDIEKSRRELLGIIGEITGSMETIFRDELTRINESFQQTFLELFGGGKAGISLEDPEDVLGSGIEIKVQPPGKTLKTITLLSGGEKAFVAIALYFAILKVRPTPFVVMDEIEAALDDANVVRVAEYMRKLCGKTQFLIITHRRGTMEEADVLYGVTMQEKGVSKVLTVDLEEAQKSIIKE